MDSKLYKGYMTYLSDLRDAEGLTDEQQWTIRKTAINYFINGNILYRRHHGKQRLVVPDTKKQMILEASHDHQLAGHMGVDNTYQRLATKYYWKEMYDDVREYIRRCDIC